MLKILSVVVGVLIIAFGVMYIKTHTVVAPEVPQEIAEEEATTEPTETEVSFTPLPELITVTSHTPGAAVASPVTVTGEARGYYYFEATFPVVLLDANNNVLLETYAEAQSDWMIEDFVPFSVTLTYTPLATPGMGTLLLKRDNPSGLPQNDATLAFPLYLQ